MNLSAALGVLGIVLKVASARKGHAAENSRAEDTPESWDVPGGDLGALWAEALDSLYSWGGGREEGAWPLGPFDCSGFVDAALRVAGAELPWARTSASSATMYAALEVNPLEPGEEAPEGAIVFYGSGKPSHVMLSVGQGVIGASGGDSKTFGDDPDARVKTFSSAWYRADVLGWAWPW